MVGSEVKYKLFSSFRPISTWAGEEDTNTALEKNWRRTGQIYQYWAQSTGADVTQLEKCGWVMYAYGYNSKSFSFFFVFITV